MKDRIPYGKIDPEIRDLIKSLNDSSIVKTYSSCAGHGDDKKAKIIFKPVNDKWNTLKDKILNRSNQLSDMNFNIYEWHRIGGIDWILEIYAHPRDRRNLFLKEKSIRSVLNRGFEIIIKIIEECGCKAKGDNIASRCPMHGDKIKESEVNGIREIELKNPYIMTGICGHFENDLYIVVEKLRFSSHSVGFYGKSFQIMSGGDVQSRGYKWINYTLKNGNGTKS